MSLFILRGYMARFIEKPVSELLYMDYKFIFSSLISCINTLVGCTNSPDAMTQEVNEFIINPISKTKSYDWLKGISPSEQKKSAYEYIAEVSRRLTYDTEFKHKFELAYLMIYNVGTKNLLDL